MRNSRHFHLPISFEVPHRWHCSSWWPRRLRRCRKNSPTSQARLARPRPVGKVAADPWRWWCVARLVWVVCGHSPPHHVDSEWWGEDLIDGCKNASYCNKRKIKHDYNMRHLAVCVVHILTLIGSVHDARKAEDKIHFTV